MQRAGVRAEYQRASVKQLHESTQSAAERAHHRHFRVLHDHAPGGEFAIGAAANQYRLQPEVAVQRIAHGGPALRQPIFLRFTCRHDDRRNRSLEDAQAFALLTAFVRPRAEIPYRRSMWHAERIEEFEILILHMLHRMRLHLRIREHPVQIARARHIEAEFHRRPHHTRDHARLQIHLQRENEIEATLGQLSTQIVVRAPAIAAFEEQDLADIRMSAHQRRRPRLQNPRYARVGPMSPERGEHRQHVHCVAHRAHHHDADTIETGAHRRAGSAHRQISPGAVR